MMPMEEKKVERFLNSPPQSVWTVFSLVENCLSAIVTNCLKVSKTSDLRFNGNSHINLEKWSTHNKK
ncbi:hypothetical protein HanXRQr2_Chr09g0417111 [Helianthus annuus]|uniref:Uncharacterized protein n=1 Tax=Helianthus annuus TaxID=4232 RepID=A0A9K3IB23_HELAN|nr:hypothetical protein HanXRQr2_Chr09g0417111 [Helianthus annuus]